MLLHPHSHVGLLGNLPFVMAPGLGLTAYFTYGLVNRKDRDATAMTWQAGLACFFIAGAAMLVLSVSFLVQRSMALVPGHIKLGTIIGIGFLLVTIGFESAGIIQTRIVELPDLASTFAAFDFAALDWRTAVPPPLPSCSLTSSTASAAAASSACP